MATTVRQLLDQARQFHQDLAAYYTSLNGTLQTPRVHMLLDYMARNEHTLESCLEKYAGDADPRVLNYCLKYTPAMPASAHLEPDEVQPDMSIDEILATALRLDDGLLHWYEQIADDATTAEVRDLFVRLAQSEQADERLTARSAAELETL